MSDSRYARSPHAVWRATASFLVAAVPPQPPTRISGSAAVVWDLMTAPKTARELSLECADVLGISASDVEADVARLMGQLLPLGLVEIS
jgi:hypothetical protein